MTSAPHDPALAQILSAVRLRAKLEILRLSRGFGWCEPVRRAGRRRGNCDRIVKCGHMLLA